MRDATLRRSVSAVIFDMDGLMLDTERISLRVWRKAATDLGYVLDDGISERMVGLNATANRALLLGHFGDSFPFDALSRLAQSSYLECLEREGVPRKPGLIELLDFLRAREVPRAVATSTVNELARHKLAQAGVLEYFSVVVGGDEIAHGKPAPDIFLLAAARLHQHAADCAVLEDSGPGIRGAHAAGMVPILVPDGRSPAEETRRLAHVVVDSLSAAQSVLESLLEGTVTRIAERGV
jgi:HAD superfamily hydrolase (TIGR01509 family)